MLKVIIGIIMLLMCFMGIFIMANKKQTVPPSPVVNHEIPLQPGQEGEIIQMIAVAETKEEAEEIAQLYDIVLIDYAYKVATYETDKDPHQLIKMGQEKGFPVIEINHRMSLF